MLNKFSLTQILTLTLYPLLGYSQQDPKLDHVRQSLGDASEFFKVFISIGGDTTLMLKDDEDNPPGDIYLFDAEINYRIRLIGHPTKKRIDVRFTKFKKQVWIAGGQFENDVSFFGCEFQDSVYATNSSFVTSSFEDCAFKKSVNFDNVFSEDNSFEKSTFAGNVFLRGSSFDQLTMNDAVFESRATIDFSRATFDGEVEIYNAIFPDSINLRFARGKNEIDFTMLRQTTKDHINRLNLYGASIDKFKVNYENFRLFFDSTITQEQKSNVYVSLINKVKSDGMMNSYKYLDFEYQRFRHSEISNNMAMYWLKYLWWGFGHEKDRIFLNTFILNVIIVLIVFANFDFFLMRSYTIEKIKQEYIKSENRSRFKKFWLAFFYTLVIFYGLKMEIDRLHFSNKLGVTLVLTFYVLGIVCVAFMFNYVISTA